MGRGRTHDGGFQLWGTPIWFDAELSRALCVITGLGAGRPGLHRRTLASVDLVPYLERLGYGGIVLPAPFARPVMLGGHEISLWDLGVGLGASAAHVSVDGRQLLVTGLLPHASRLRVSTWPKAHRLVVQAPGLGWAGRALDEVVEEVGALRSQGEQSQGEQSQAEPSRAEQKAMRLVVMVDCISAGVAFYQALANRGIAAKAGGALARLVQPLVGAVAVQDEASIGSKKAKKKTEKLPSGGISIWLSSGRPRLSPRTQVVWISTGLKLPSRAYLGDRILELAWHASSNDIRDLARRVGAKQITVLGGRREARDGLAEILGKGIRLEYVGQAQQLSLGNDFWPLDAAASA